MKDLEKRRKKIERHVELGYRCKNCKKPINLNSKLSKVSLCDDCEKAAKEATSPK